MSVGLITAMVFSAACAGHVGEVDEPESASVDSSLVDGTFTQRADVYDYLVMDVCTTGGPDGAIDRTLLPHRCRASGNWRNLTPAVTSGTRLVRKGDDLYYRNHNTFRNSNPAFAYGHSAWSNYPIVHDGVRRVVLVKDHGRVPAGVDTFGQLAAGERDGMSLRWMGATNAFMLLTVSPGQYGYSVNKETCASGPPRSFQNYWHMPKDIASRAPGAVWAGVGNSTLFAQRHPKKLPSCSAMSFAAVYNTAVRLNAFAFTGGMSMRTIVHQKFSGSNPHSADAFERIYFTREYGITRWEVWKKGAAAAGATFYRDKLAADGRPPECSAPVAYPSGGGLTTSAVSLTATGGYVQRFKTTGAGEAYHLTDCEDFTGKILIGAELDAVYGALKDVKWSFLDINRFLARPASGDPLPDSKAYFFKD
jgi:hypothetical protein